MAGMRRNGRLAVIAALAALTASPSLAAPAPPDSTGRLDMGAVGSRVGRTDARIRYVLPRAASVRVTILDARGRTVQVLAEGQQPAGPHESRWNGLSADGTPSPTGVYIAHVEAGGASGSRHLILVQ